MLEHNCGVYFNIIIVVSLESFVLCTQKGIQDSHADLSLNELDLRLNLINTQVWSFYQELQSPLVSGLENRIFSSSKTGLSLPHLIY